MHKLKNNFLLFSIQFVVFYSSAQEGTRIYKDNPLAVEGKIMIIPFEPLLYMSEIDFKINQITKWNFDQIRENFRKQLNMQLKLKFQSIAPVVSFYSDSAKMSKDLLYIYNSTGLSYDLISNSNEVKKTPASQNGIKNGQLVVEVNTEKKFMSTRINDSKLLSYLEKKYDSHYFVFINQMDIKNNMESYDIASDTYQREMAVHYSILDKNGKNISSGLAKAPFSSKVDDPKKIVAQTFPPIATFIALKLSELSKPELITIQKK